MSISEELLSAVAACAAEAAGISESDRGEAKVVYENDDFSVLLVNSTSSLRDALSVMREGFYPNESICQGVKLGTDLHESDIPHKVNENQISGERGIAELELLTLETAKDGISLVVMDKATGKIAGATFNKIQSCSGSGEEGFFESFRDEHCQNLSAIAEIDIMIKVDSMFDVFEHYKVSTALEIMFLATYPGFERRGIGALLVKASFEAAKARGIPLVVAQMTSLYTQRIGRSVGMEELKEISHDELTFLGEPISVRTGIHKSTIIMAKRIEVESF